MAPDSLASLPFGGHPVAHHPLAELLPPEPKPLPINGKKASANRLYRVWTTDEEQSLIAGVRQLGVGSWEAIRMSQEFNLSGRSALQLKDKWRNLVKYGHVATAEFADPPATKKRKAESGELVKPDGFILAHVDPVKRSKSVVSTSSAELDSLTPALSTSAEPQESQQATQDVVRLASSSAAGRHDACLAGSRVKTASDILQAALQILADANQSVSSALAASATSVDEMLARENVRSASFIASLAQQKVARAKSYLDETLRELATAQTSSGGEQCSFVAEAEDTADSQYATETGKKPSFAQTKTGSPMKQQGDCHFPAKTCAGPECDDMRFEDWASVLLDDIDSELSGHLPDCAENTRSFPSQASFSSICAM